MEYQYIEYYPISYRIVGGELTGHALAYDAEGEEYSLQLAATLTRAGFRDLSRALRSWLHGRVVYIQGDAYQLLAPTAVLSEPLTAAYA